MGAEKPAKFHRLRIFAKIRKLRNFVGCEISQPAKFCRLRKLAILQDFYSGPFFFILCDAPKPGGPLTTRQPVETLVNVG